MTSYCRREWLNPGWSSFTGSVVGWVGLHKHEDGTCIDAVFEVADCHHKARLHCSVVSEDDRVAFVMKVRKLAEVANEIADFVEKMEITP